MRYDYECKSCNNIWNVDKSIKDPAPILCPRCKGIEVERHYGLDDVPYITYANRPPWTYKECLKYKDCKFNDGPRTKIDPSKHGDLGSWNSPGEVIPSRKTKKS